MATSPMSEFIQHLRRTMLVRDGADSTDGQLLEDYICRRDEAALAALVQRHAPMVWGVCRRVLLNYHDAEDAFQATFLVLVRKATSIRPREMLANWLYGVAHQTALKARATTAKRCTRERQVTDMPEPAVVEQDLWHDLQPRLDEELSRLPGKYRAVIVLCDLEGKTRKEAARQLGVPEGTVASRLATARAMLAKQFARRGVVLSGGALAAVLSQHVASAGVPPSVVSSTIKAASLFTAGPAAGIVSAKVAALTGGVVKAMFVSKFKSVLAVVLGAGLTLGGIGAGVGLSTNPVEVPQKPGAAPDDAKKPDGKMLLPGEIKRELNQGVVLRVKLVELDPKALRMTADVEPTRGKTPKPLRLANLGIAGNVRVSDAKKELKLTDLKAGNILRLQLESWRLDGEEMAITYIRVEDDTEKKPKKGKDDQKQATKQEKLRVLIDKVLAAHGGEEKLNKLKFLTETVKQNNGTTVRYLVQLPDHIRVESQHRDTTIKQIWILFPHGRQWWKKHPNGETEPIHYTGAEPTMEFWLDYVKFFGPRRVLRLKDADHRVTLLEEEVKIDGRAAVGVEVTYAVPNAKFTPLLRMYFDKQTHLLVKLGDTYYGDYKKFDGIPIAQKEKQPGYMETEVTDFRAVDKLDAKLFEQP